MAGERGPESHLPTGRQFQLRCGAQEAVITEVGATLREYMIDGQPVVDGFPQDQRSSDGRGQLLIPWPNRIEDGRYEFGGSEYQLPLNELDHRTAIHGLTRWLSWALVTAREDSVVLETTVAEQPGYEFSVKATAEYRLGPGGLTATVRAKNLGSSTLPIGLGAHPYLRLGTGGVDDLELCLPATLRFDVDHRGIPRGDPVPVENTIFDFRQPRTLGGLALDTTFTGLIRGSDGVARVQLTALEDKRTVHLWVDRSQDYLQLFTGDTLKEPSARRRGLAVEPMTCAPNAFGSGRGLVVLAPRDTLTAQWGIVVS